MKRKLLTALTAAVCALPICAQPKSENLKKMNEIKAQGSDYLWSQYLHSDADSAHAGAAQWLLISVNTSLGKEMLMDEVMPKMKYIDIERGSRIQCFAYVRKNDLTSVGVIPYSEPDKRPARTSPSPTTRTVSPVVHNDKFIQDVLKQKDFYAVYDYLSQQKQGGKILQFGSLKDVDDFSSFDLILFDKQSHEVITILSQARSDGTRTNLVTGKDDRLDNYPTEMMLAVWYIKAY